LSEEREPVKKNIKSILELDLSGMKTNATPNPTAAALAESAS